MNHYRVRLDADDAPDAIILEIDALTLASLVVKIMTICRQLHDVTGITYEAQEIILTC